MKRMLVAALLIMSISLTAAEKVKTVTLAVTGMTCQSCANTVEKALKGVKGVKEAKVDLKKNQATVTLASTKTTAAVLIKAVGDAGFDAKEATAMKTEVKKEMKMGDGECEDGCCGEDEGHAKPMKAKKGEAKKS
ncbi:MAG: heavy-metal-associated domain-containing protein [Bacteroidetes bacterium]|nr:heavy-metal-associated domain-containing protein [Bacteroidota bacterium]